KNISFNVNSDEIDWLEFDKDNLILSGVPPQVGEFDIIFISVDEFSNKTEDIIKLTIVK
ncbi:MAG: hypothetical protein GY714_22315, partial [Desulfobacterales bacterium]|nr:hypothetical protein [Desulfobacterales bacterium]